ncbi:MAG: hypothetical protein FWC27_02155 [Firmicutes bacterium]|nr:hypothetical protein [Bacillota bacterium]
MYYSTTHPSPVGILAYLEDTSQTEAAMAVFAMNAAACLRALVRLFLRRLSLLRSFS